ncbi:MAG: penicillin-binding protein activator, partial [Alphaproteobacteria bacterium]
MITDCINALHQPIKQMKGKPGLVAALLAVWAIAACTPVSEKNLQTTDTRPSITTSQSSATSPAEETPDIVGDIISEIENPPAPAAEIIAPGQEVVTASPGQAPLLDKNAAKRQALAEQALKAALSLLKNRDADSFKPPQPFSAPAKSGQLRIGLMLPFSGSYAGLGRDIASGAELALFQLADPKTSLIYFDTAGGSRAADAAREAIEAEVDIVIGPLFTQSAIEARTILAASAIPAISLSNNVQAATPGQWVLGYLPEQQIDHLLGHAIAQNRTKIAILASEDMFGQRLLSHTQNRLASFCLTAAEWMTLPQPVLADEDSLRQAVQQFTRYQKPDPENPQLPEPAYDALILAGNPDFILRVAPVLSYYDMDPSRVMYLGTDLWARPELLAEPSLQGAVITQALQPASPEFEERFQSLFDKPTNHLVKMGFDAFALVAITHQG